MGPTSERMLVVFWKIVCVMVVLMARASASSIVLEPKLLGSCGYPIDCLADYSAECCSVCRGTVLSYGYVCEDHGTFTSYLHPVMVNNEVYEGATTRDCEDDDFECGSLQLDFVSDDSLTIVVQTPDDYKYWVTGAGENMYLNIQMSNFVRVNEGDVVVHPHIETEELRLRAWTSSEGDRLTMAQCLAESDEDSDKIMKQQVQVKGVAIPGYPEYTANGKRLNWEAEVAGKTFTIPFDSEESCAPDTTMGEFLWNLKSFALLKTPAPGYQFLVAEDRRRQDNKTKKKKTTKKKKKTTNKKKKNAVL